MSDADALERLERFLRDELRRDDLPPDLRGEYEQRLARLLVPAADASIDELPLSSRARGYLRRSGIATVGELAALTDDERAALPYMGPQFLAEIRAALGER